MKSTTLASWSRVTIVLSFSSDWQQRNYENYDPTRQLTDGWTPETKTVEAEGNQSKKICSVATGLEKIFMTTAKTPYLKYCVLNVADSNSSIVVYSLN